MSKILDEAFESISLETKIKVRTEMAFISLLSELGFRKDTSWTHFENELLEKLLSSANEHSSSLLKIFYEYKHEDLDNIEKQILGLKKHVNLEINSIVDSPYAKGKSFAYTEVLKMINKTK